MDQYDNNFPQPEQEASPDTASEPKPLQQEAAPEIAPEPQPLQQDSPPAPSAQPQMPPQQSYSYRGEGSGRRESPYANSPYVMQPPQQPYYGYSPAYQQAPQYQAPQYQAPQYQPPQYQPPQPPRKNVPEKKKGGFWRTSLAAVLILATVATGCFVTAIQVNHYWSARTQTLQQETQTLRQETQTLQQQLQDMQEQLDDVAKVTAGTSVSGTPATVGAGLTPSQVYAKNVASVVAISNQSTTNYFGQVSETASSGSGFILTEDGYIVSNYHVVSGANKLTVILHDGTEYDAQLIGGDENNDIALLKVEATGLQAVTVGSSDDLVVGDQVVAIGNPLGELTSTQTVGYISAKDRDVTTDGTTINMMQTDAAINPGNSGGPLFNMKGEVVGITTAKYSGTTNSGASIEGIGFAIPIDDVMSMLTDLKDRGYITGAYLGISVRSMDPAVAKAYGLPTGSQVASVEPGSCSEKGGMQEMDIIVKLGEFEVSDNNDLLRALRKHKAGDTVTVVVWRSGVYVDLTITLDEKPQPDQP